MALYIFHIIIGSLVFLSTVVMTLWFKTNRILNTYLIAISLVLCLYLILLGVEKSFNIDLFINLNYYQVILTLTPATFLFFQKLIFNIKYPEKKDFWYFVLPLLLFFFVGNNFRFKWYRISLFIFFVVYILFYLILIIRFLNKHIWDLNQTKSYAPVVINWASFIFKMLLLVFLHFSIVLISQTFNVGNDYNLFIEFSLLIVFLIGYFKVIVSPELLYGHSNFSNTKWVSSNDDIAISSVWSIEIIKKISAKKDSYLKDKIGINVIEYISDIEKIAINEFSFRNNKYSLNDLSLQLGVPKYYIEYIFKYHCEINFNDYKRLVRVYDSILLIKQGYLKNNTLNSLAEFVGFSSYNPFLLSFKQISGVSPYDFNKNRKLINTSINFN